MLAATSHKSTEWLVATILICVTSISLVSSCGGSSTRLHGRDVAATPTAIVGLLVTRAPRTANDVVPTEVVEQLLSGNVHQRFTSADIHFARRVSANEPYWLMPASNGELCLVGLIFPITSRRGQDFPPAVRLACATAAAAREGQLMLTQTLVASVGQRPVVRITGIARDGVASVSVLLRHGHSVSAAVVRNAYEVVVVDPVGVKVGGTLVPVAVFSARNAAPAQAGGGGLP